MSQKVLFYNIASFWGDDWCLIDVGHHKWPKQGTHCLKITENDAFEFSTFGILHQFLFY